MTNCGIGFSSRCVYEDTCRHSFVKSHWGYVPVNLSEYRTIVLDIRSFLYTTNSLLFFVCVLMMLLVVDGGIACLGIRRLVLFYDVSFFGSWSLFLSTVTAKNLFVSFCFAFVFHKYGTDRSLFGTMSRVYLQVAGAATGEKELCSPAKKRRSRKGKRSDGGQSTKGDTKRNVRKGITVQPYYPVSDSKNCTEQCRSDPKGQCRRCGKNCGITPLVDHRHIFNCQCSVCVRAAFKEPPPETKAEATKRYNFEERRAKKIHREMKKEVKKGRQHTLNTFFHKV